MKTVARANFERDGELIPIAAFLMTKNPETREELPGPQVAFLPLIDGALNPENKDKLAEFIRMFAERAGCIGYVMCVEAWALEGSKADFASVEGEVSKHPDRKEVVMCNFEHVGFEGSRLWMADIDRASGTPTLKEFADFSVTGPGAVSGGRFVGVLPRTGAALA
jgi:hypothetical protein